MSQPSQELFNQQLEVKKLRKEASILEQTIQHRQNEARAVQKKISDLDDQFIRKTNRLTEEQIKAIEDLVRPLQEELATLQPEIDKQKLIIVKNSEILDQQQGDIVVLDTAFQEVDRKLNEATTSLAILEAKKNQIVRENKQLEDKTEFLSVQITELVASKTSLVIDLKELSTNKEVITGSINKIEFDHESKVLEKEIRLKQIDQEVLKLTQDREATLQEDNTIRDEFARRERTLNERDKNLRMREAKVEMGEGKILNNANLMNL